MFEYKVAHNKLYCTRLNPSNVCITVSLRVKILTEHLEHIIHCN